MKKLQLSMQNYFSKQIKSFSQRAKVQTAVVSVQTAVLIVQTTVAFVQTAVLSELYLPFFSVFLRLLCENRKLKNKFYPAFWHDFCT
ncbi:MAG: hypothetical protein IKN48_11025 [Bacteroidaceae bacterium]|nr:hypothetical protein [Bacteroidaceae bacterium]